MKMNQSTIALASLLALACGTTQAQAQAQSSVTLYGLLDAAVERVDNVGAGGDSVVRMPTLAGSVASRWGLRGSEDLGDGLKAVFVLESGFGVDSGVPQQSTGTQTRLFGRQAYVGLSGSWGSFTMGRQYSQLFNVQPKTDPFLASAYGDGAFDLFLAGPRYDNAVSYGGKFGGLYVGALYSFGRTTGDGPAACPGEAAGDSDNCTAWSLGAMYEGTGWGLGAWADEQNSAAGDPKRYIGLNGYYVLGKTKLMANYLDIKDEQPLVDTKAQLWSLAVSHPVTEQITLEGAYYDYDLDDSDNDAQMFVVRANYAFSKRTTAYIYAAHLANDGTRAGSVSVGVVPTTSVLPAAGKGQTGFMVGLRHSF